MGILSLKFCGGERGGDLGIFSVLPRCEGPEGLHARRCFAVSVVALTVLRAPVNGGGEYCNSWSRGGETSSVVLFAAGAPAAAAAAPAAAPAAAGAAAAASVAAVLFLGTPEVLDMCMSFIIPGTQLD